MIQRDFTLSESTKTKKLALGRKAILIAGGLMSFKYPEWVHYARQLNLDIYSIDPPSEQNQQLISNVNSAFVPTIWPDKVALINASDVGLFLRTALQWSSEVQFETVFTITDQYAVPTALAAMALDLRNVGLFASYVSRDRLIQRQLLKSNSPKFVAFNVAELRDVLTTSDFTLPALPFIIKPTGRSASSGVHRVKTLENLLELFSEAYRDDETILIEEIITGQEYSVESVVVSGEIKWFGITKKNTNEGYSDSSCVEMTHIVPGTIPGSSIEAALVSLNELAIQQCKVETGTTHLEARITAAGRALLMEMAVRSLGLIIEAFV